MENIEIPTATQAMNSELAPHLPDATQNKFNYSISIEPLNRGFVVRVGCQTFAFETHEKMLKYLTEYLTNPKGFETNYREGLVLKEEY